MKILLLKDNYNSFEQFYIDELNKIGIDANFYYFSNSKLRKFWTHLGVPLEKIWYGNWKKKLKKYNVVIVFDSIHTSNLIKYLYKNSNAKIIFWHWNPLKKKDIKILKKTLNFCEHWTFNHYDSNAYNIKFNNQFFFFKTNYCNIKENKAFFVGTDKGRYNQICSIAEMMEKNNIIPDFYIIDKNKIGKFYKKNYMDYYDVLEHLRCSKIAIEIVQEGQDGLTTRALEAMFLGTKLITNNKSIKQCEFYKKENVYIIGEENLKKFLNTPFNEIEKEKLEPYSAQGWINKFLEE